MSTNTYSPFVLLDRAINAGNVANIMRSARHSGALALVSSKGSKRHVFTSAPPNEFSPASRVDIGCIVKNLTALLTAVAVSEGLLDLDERVDRFFPEVTGIDGTLKVCHLLNHSHGLDSSSLPLSPFGPDGRIDAVALWEGLNQLPPTSSPGALFYYYGMAGYWLASAIIERIYDAKFETLVEEWILPQIDVRPRPEGAAGLFPGNGGLMLSANELINLGRLNLESSGNPALDQAIRALRQTHRMDIPAWPPFAEGATPGWFAYPGGTFGMFGRSTIGSAFFLVSPEDGAVLALTGSAKHVITLVRRSLIGSVVGEREPRPPRLLKREERAGKDFHEFVGKYGKARLVLDVQCDSQGEIIASLHERSSPRSEIADEPVLSRRLLPGVDNVFFPVPPERSAIPYIRFMCKGADGMYEYAFTTKHLFRRIAS